jgi:hypothetical protein
MSAEMEGFLLTESAPAPKPKPAKHTEASMIDLLHQRYNTRSGNGAKYVGMSHVRSDAGFDAKRTADFMALDLWPSSGLMLHGHEVKISRSDWLNELKDPEKSGAFIPHVDYWWLVIAERGMVRAGELPANWGMMAVDGDGVLRVVKQAPRLRTNPLQRGVYPTVQRGLAAAMLRSAAKTAVLAERKQQQDLVKQFRDTHTLASETHVLEEWGAADRKYLPVATFTDLNEANAELQKAKDGGKRLHLVTHRTYTYTETEWI